MIHDETLPALAAVAFRAVFGNHIFAATLRGGGVS